MKVSKLVIAAAVFGVVTLATLTSTAYAWHPKGAIIKKVQNVTAGSVLADADTISSAVAAKPGDTLKYVIEVRNDGKPDSKGWNDMAKTVMTDSLPAGVSLVSDPAKRQITENLGTLKPGQKVTKEYLVKVSASSDTTISNTACFTGDSKVNDAPQKGCNPAVVTITVPPVVEEPPVTPEVPETPEVPVTPEMPAELPKTGTAENILATALALGAAFYAAYRYVQSKRDLSDALISQR